VAGGLDSAQSADRRLRRSLAATGLTEAWTTAFGSPDDFDALGLGSSHPSRRSVAVANPMLEDERILRTTMIPGLLRAVARNVAHRATDLALFEIARVYEPTSDRLPREATLLSGVCCGNREAPGWQGRSAPWDFFAVKGALHRALEASGWPALEYSAAAGSPFHPTRAAAVSLEGAKLGAIGELDPRVCENFEVPEGCVAFEIALAPLLSRPPGRASVEELPRYPAAHIDVALVVDENVPAGTLLQVVRSAGAPEVASVRLFDLYRGPQVPEGKKSLAFALELRSPSKTLTDEEALGIRDRIVAAAAERYGAELRA
jgi:phenylalanyl-tRNA synthetase beta chain